MSSENLLKLVVGAALVLGLIALMKKKESFHYRQDVPMPVDPSTVTRPQSAAPGFLAETAPRTDGVTQGGGSLVGAAPPQPLMAAPAAPVNAMGTPDFAQLGGLAAQTIPSGAITTQQASDILQNRFGVGSPKYIDTVELMPVPDMRYSAGVDPTDPQSFMYDRTIFGRLKRRYGNQVDFFRGDLDLKPESRGWFDLQPPTDVDVVKGYFDNYIDIQQETAIKDATFNRTTPVQKLFEATVNPFGRTDKLAYSKI